MGAVALATVNAIAGTKIVYSSITACVQDLYANTSHTKNSAKEVCVDGKEVEVNYGSISACVQDLYANTSHTKDSAKEACMNH